MKFNVGDRVRAVAASASWGNIKLNDIGTIVEMDNASPYPYRVDFPAQAYWSAQESDLDPLFEVGMEVECICTKNAVQDVKDWLPTRQYLAGDRMTIVKITRDGLLIFSNNYCRYNPQCFKPVDQEANVGMEPRKITIIERIQALKDGWNKEADAILNEIRGEHGFIVWQGTLHHSIFITSRAPVTLRYDGELDPGTKLLARFEFSDKDSCEKNRAFKKALLFLAEEHIKLSVGSEVKAEIEGKTYKVKILERIP